jgi:REP element-mobilizing transposase RayT
MKKALRRPPVRFTGEQARAVGRGMAEIVNEMRLVVYAAAIMPDHVHVVAARQELYAETLAGYLKRAAARKLGEEGLHPFADQEGDAGDIPSCWERGGWKVFLHMVDEIEPAVLYVQNNPPEAGLPLQQWSFVSRFES